jgi:hypothetical protein
VRPRFAIVHLRHKSLLRGILLSLGPFLGSLLLAGFPHIENLHGSRWQIVMLLLEAWGMGEVTRCLQRTWNLYHGGVLLLLYSDLMILVMMAFLVAYP